MARLARVVVADDGAPEYDGNNRLVRKYVYGPGVDQPVCMIDVPDSNAAYYYHFDGLGSVIALSDADGNTAVVYDYDVYGRAAASDPNHPNPFLFTARRFDTETGLYYYRARYYNPYIGRFLQTDPIGYADGMNWYGYCANNATNCVDPSGLKWEDPALRIVLYDGSWSLGGWIDRLTDGMAVNDPFFDVVIDISGAAAEEAGYSSSADYIKHIFEDEGILRKMIEDQEPDDPYLEGKKLYDWDAQVTIEGLWILDHGNTYGDTVTAPGGTAFTTIFSAIGKGLDASHSAGATINLRCCTGVYTDAWVLMDSAAKLSGHAVTAPLGTLYVFPASLPVSLHSASPGYAPWACSKGFGIVSPRMDSEGKIYYSPTVGYKGGAEIGQRVELPLRDPITGLDLSVLVWVGSTHSCVW